MGGAISKDPGRIHYKVHNIYLNFVETYGRIKPNEPFTIHQKALFLFWLSVIILWLIIIAKKGLTFLRTSTSPEKGLNANRSIEEGTCKDTDEEAAEPKVEQKLPDGISSIGKDSVIQGVSPTLDHSELDLKGNNELYKKIIMGSVTSIQRLKGGEKDKQPTELSDNKIQMSILERVFEFFTATSREQPSFHTFLGKTSLFGLFMFYIWLCDHLHLWPKVEKQYSRDAFLFLFLVLVLVSAIFSIKSTKDVFLNRDQTEEWKGWMQVQFVWYHYFDAQEVFNSIRCYIAAYVWMTGYGFVDTFLFFGTSILDYQLVKISVVIGNFSFFWNKQDYSVFRLLKMMFRLNFLVLVVMGVTNSEFVRYYICAMHTYWFLSVWAMMAVLNRHNTNRVFMVGKLIVYALVNALIFELPGASNTVFSPFSFILNVKGNLSYWIYRSTLDHWTTFVGMIVAYNFNNINKLLEFIDSNTKDRGNSCRQLLNVIVSLSCIVVFILWFYFVLTLPRETYVKVHPYSSPIPVLIYIWLRNMHPTLRTHYMDVFAWLGKITLETYLAQIHMYMIGDAKKILVYLPNYPLLNFLLATVIYIFVSYNLFHLTVFFSSYLLPRDLKVIAKNIVIGIVWFAICYSVAIYGTTMGYWSSQKTGLEFLLWKVR